MVAILYFGVMMDASLFQPLVPGPDLARYQDLQPYRQFIEQWRRAKAGAKPNSQGSQS